MSYLPDRLYTAAQTRALDSAAINDHGMPGYSLMSAAGERCFMALRVRWPDAGTLNVFCGGGNNGGDGYIIARLAIEAGLDVVVIAISNPSGLQGDAARAHDDLIAAGGKVQSWSSQIPATGLVVDALLGTGLDRSVGGVYAEVVAAINDSGLPVLSVDIPSGLSADTGAMLGSAVRAALTVSFIGLKRGLLTGQATSHVGELIFDDLGVPAAIYAEVPADCRLLDRRAIAAQLPPRAADSHKGSYGSVLVVGGDEGMPGAVLMTATAVLRSGAGLVKVATRASHAGGMPLARPELMAAPVEDAGALSPLLQWADVIALGPGLGRSPWSVEMLECVLATAGPMVIDADGLNLLARSKISKDNWILTPHPGEAATLLDTTVAEVQRDRFSAAAAITAAYGGVCVLKGAGTVVAGKAGLRVCNLGNPGMATAGMGDVLTGVIAAMLAQGLDPETAADVAVCCHALAGDLAAEGGERGLLAGDVIDHLRMAVNP